MSHTYGICGENGKPIDHDTAKEQTWLQRTAWLSLGTLALVLVLAVVAGFAEGVLR